MIHHTPARSQAMAPLQPTAAALAEMGSDAIAMLLAGAADIMLALDAEGTIVDIAYGDEPLSKQFGTDWVGRHWADTVSEESRPKVAAMLGTPSPGAMRWRQVNHPVATGGSIAISYTSHAVPAATRGAVHWFAFGRDQRVTAALQQRLVEAQLSVERDYARFRQAELRYRQLFQLAGEAVLMLDAGSTRVLEANPAATAMLGMSADKLAGQTFPLGLSADSASRVTTMLATARRTGQADAVAAELAESGEPLQVAATLLRQDQSHLLLVRMTRRSPAPAAAAGSDEPAGLLLDLAEHAPDGLVITDDEGHVLAANAEFVNLCQAGHAAAMRGVSLERWLGRTGVDLGVLVSNLRQRGTVKLFATTLRGDYGVSTDVEISAVAVPGSDPLRLGFSVRDVGRRLPAETAGAQVLPRSVNQLTELVGRVPMKDIVGETTDLIEKRCIEAALELTRDNRASAAEILGLSRQSLYVKLRRYGLGDLGPGLDNK